MDYKGDFMREIYLFKFIYFYQIQDQQRTMPICKGKFQQLQSRKQNNRLTCCGHVLPVVLLVCSVNSQFSRCSHYDT